MAFLAIPFVESNNNSFWMSPAAVLSQVSTIASLGSIIVGLLLTRQLRMTAKESADDAVSCFYAVAIAILVSLEHALAHVSAKQKASSAWSRNNGNPI